MSVLWTIGFESFGLRQDKMNVKNIIAVLQADLDEWNIFDV